MTDIYDQQSNRMHLLRIERMKRGEWWVELIDKPTGHVQLLITKSKKAAFEMFKDMELPEIKKAMDRWNVPLVPMYKPKV